MIVASTAGWIGGIAGAVIGLAGGIFGTYCGLRSARGPRERAFLVRAAIGFWILVLGFLAAQLLITTWHRHLLWLVYAPVLTWAIIATNRTQTRLRREEGTEETDRGGEAPWNETS